MQYVLKNEIKISRPILFLCGPYYDKKNKSDRRLLLQNAIYDCHRNKYLPLVIDDFLTQDNIKDETISIQLMEEICAAISAQTYIFLDTISAAAELGFFANSAYFNKIKVFIPKESDINNKKNVGYFVRDVVLEKHKDRVEAIEYRPAIERVAIATDYTVEHYNFIDDELPANIKKCIIEDPIFKENESHCISLKNTAERLTSPYDIHYQVEADEVHINVSIKLLFYAVLSVITCDYKDIVSQKSLKPNDFNLEDIKEKTKRIFVNYIESNTNTTYANARIDTALKFDYEKIVHHIVTFVYVYHKYSSFHRQFLLTNPIGRIIEKIEVKAPLNALIPLSEEQRRILLEVIKNKDAFYEKVYIVRGKKRRELIKYKDDEKGHSIREVHKYINDCLNKKYSPNSNSFAYQKGKNIKSCVESHLGGRGFIKYDIKKFFNSIKYEKLKQKIIDIFTLDERFANDIDLILSTCFYNGQLPLGLIISPLFSDMYMKSFDETVSRRIGEKDITYTRYADDILISKTVPFTTEESAKIEGVVDEELRKAGLVKNEEKSRLINFDDSHHFIKYIGVNIVKKDDGNHLSIGKSYINQVAKDYLIYVDKAKHVDSQNIYEDELFYTKQRIIGKIGFIKSIEGNEGIKKLKNRLRKHVPNLDVNAI